MGITSSQMYFYFIAFIPESALFYDLKEKKIHLALQETFQF
jgi:hypothetical protein